jgi:predicted PurR-regulated permease PerM
MTDEPAAKLAKSRPPQPSRSAVTMAEAARIALAVAGVIALVTVLWFARTAILLAFAGILLAILLDGMSRPLRRMGLPKSVAIPVVVLLIALFFVVVGWSAGPVLIEQLKELGQYLAQTLTSFGQEAASQANQDGILQRLDWSELIGLLPSPLGLASGATAVASSIAGAITALLLVIFFGIYFALDPDIYVRLLVHAVPPERQDEVRTLLAEISRVLHRWLNGQLIAMAAIGTVTYLGLVLLGMPLALVLALLIGLFEFIPYIGPILGAVPMLLIASGQGFEMMLWVAGLYLFVQLLEGYLLTPLIQSRAVSMPPAAVITSQLVFGAMFGVLGLALATPLAAAASVPLRRYLGDNSK